MWHAVTNCGVEPTVVLCGDATGVDKLGAKWAALRSIPVEHYPADWAKHPKRAGMLRNTQMAHLCDAVVAVWDGKSPGTLDMVAKAAALGKLVVLRQVP